VAPPPVQRIGVAGAGTMGAGIAQVAALGGYLTYLHDPDPEALAAGEQRLRDDLLKGADRGRWTRAEAEAASARLRAARRLDQLTGCELVIEAAPESLEQKRALFRELESICAGGTVLATNTSSLSVTEIAAAAARPERICGMHFFNPPALMELVEVVAGARTAPETLGLAEAVSQRMGRTPIRAADGIGFLANRCARPFTLEALRLVGERIARPDQVDRIVRIGGGYRMGPFELMDLVGVDVNLQVARSFFEQSGGEPRWKPHALHERLVVEGRLGRKSGRGWYDYGRGPHRPQDPEIPVPDHRARTDPRLEASVDWVALPNLTEARLVELAPVQPTPPGVLSAAGRHFAALGKQVDCVLGDAPGLVLGRIVAQLVNEACFAVEEGVGTVEDVDTALRLGFNHPRGPFEWARAIGPGEVLGTLDALRSQLGEDRYRAAPLLRRWAVVAGPSSPTEGEPPLDPEP
jgi:3-hydroxybutyryl-CoA dehydrogenase